MHPAQLQTPSFASQDFAFQGSWYSEKVLRNCIGNTFSMVLK